MNPRNQFAAFGAREPMSLPCFLQQTAVVHAKASEHDPRSPSLIVSQASLPRSAQLQAPEPVEIKKSDGPLPRPLSFETSNRGGVASTSKSEQPRYRGRAAGSGSYKAGRRESRGGGDPYRRRQKTKQIEDQYAYRNLNSKRLAPKSRKVQVDVQEPAPRPRKPPPTMPQKQLNETIVAAESAPEILDILQNLENPEDLTCVNAATAFQRLAKHAQKMTELEAEELRQDPRTQQLAVAVDAFSDSWGGYALSNIVWAHHALGHGLPSLPGKAWTRFLEKLQTMRPLEMGCTLLAISKCGQLTEEQFDELHDPLIQWLDTRQEVLSERSINGMLWPYAKAERRDVAVVERLADRTKACLQANHVHSRGLANLAWCFAKLEHFDEGLFDLLAGHAVARLQREQPGTKGAFSAFDIGNFSWAFAKAFSAASGDNPDHSRDDFWVLEHISRVPVRLMVFKLIVRKAPAVADQLTASGMSSLVWSLACIGYYDAPLMAVLVPRIARNARSYTIVAIAIIFWSLAALRYDAPKAMEAMADTLLRLHDAGRLERVLHEQNVTMIILACAHIDCRHMPKCQRLTEVLAEIVAASKTEILGTSKGLSNVAWGLSCLDSLDEGLFRQICIRLTKLDQGFEHELTQIYQADLLLRLLPAERRCLEDTTATDVWEFLEECFNLGRLKMASSRHWRRVLRKNFRSVTDLHWDVATTLERIGGSFAVEYEAEDYSVDIAMVDQRIAIEVDGPVHFTRNTRRPLGFHILKRTLLQRRGWTVVNIPFYDWNSLRSRGDKDGYLLHALEEAGWQQLQEEEPSGSVLERQNPLEGPENSESQAALDRGVGSNDGEGEPPPAFLSDSRMGEEGVKSDEESGFGALSRSDRLAIVRQGQSKLSKHQMLIKRATKRTH